MCAECTGKRWRVIEGCRGQQCGLVTARSENVLINVRVRSKCTVRLTRRDPLGSAFFLRSHSVLERRHDDGSPPCILYLLATALSLSSSPHESNASHAEQRIVASSSATVMSARLAGLPASQRCTALPQYLGRSGDIRAFPIPLFG